MLEDEMWNDDEAMKSSRTWMAYTNLVNVKRSSCVLLCCSALLSKKVVMKNRPVQHSSLVLVFVPDQTISCSLSPVVAVSVALHFQTFMMLLAYGTLIFYCSSCNTRRIVISINKEVTKPREKHYPDYIREQQLRNNLVCLCFVEKTLIELLIEATRKVMPVLLNEQNVEKVTVDY